jgi:hypothetical protein
MVLRVPAGKIEYGLTVKCPFCVSHSNDVSSVVTELSCQEWFLDVSLEMKM